MNNNFIERKWRPCTRKVYKKDNHPIDFYHLKINKMYNNVIYVIDFIKKQKSIKCDREIKNTEKGKRKKRTKRRKRRKAPYRYKFIQVYHILHFPINSLLFLRLTAYFL